MQWLNAGKCVGGLRPQRLLKGWSGGGLRPQRLSKDGWGGGLRPQRLLKGCVCGTLRANIWLGCCQLMHGNVTMYEFELSVSRRTSRMHPELEPRSQTAKKNISVLQECVRCWSRRACASQRPLYHVMSRSAIARNFYDRSPLKNASRAQTKAHKHDKDEKCVYEAAAPTI